MTAVETERRSLGIRICHCMPRISFLWNLAFGADM
jgi:hypothetical protein